MRRTRLGTALVLAWTIAISGCLTPPIFYRMEYARIERDAKQRFPLGSNAARFEQWFASRGAIFEPAASVAEQCEPRSMVLARVEGCMNLITANYCVGPEDRLVSLSFSDAGHC